MLKSNDRSDRFTLMWFADRGAIHSKSVSYRHAKCLILGVVAYSFLTSLATIAALFLWQKQFKLTDQIAAVKHDLFMVETRYNEVFETAYADTPEVFVLAEEQSLEPGDIGARSFAQDDRTSQQANNGDSPNMDLQLALGGDQLEPLLGEPSQQIEKDKLGHQVASHAGIEAAQSLAAFEEVNNGKFFIEIGKLLHNSSGLDVEYTVKNKLAGKKVNGRLFIHVVGFTGNPGAEKQSAIFYPEQLGYMAAYNKVTGIVAAEKFNIQRLKAVKQFVALPLDFQPSKIAVVGTDEHGSIIAVAVKSLEKTAKDKPLFKAQAH